MAAEMTFLRLQKENPENIQHETKKIIVIKEKLINERIRQYEHILRIN
jgi:hypothetical protein